MRQGYAADLLVVQPTEPKPFFIFGPAMESGGTIRRTQAALATRAIGQVGDRVATITITYRASMWQHRRHGCEQEDCTESKNRDDFAKARFIGDAQTQLPMCLSNQAFTVACHCSLFFGLSTQWFSSGK